MYFFRISKRIAFLSIIIFSVYLLSAQEKTNSGLSYPDSINKYFLTDSTKTISFINNYIKQARYKNNKADLFDAYHALESFYYQHNDTLQQIKYTDKLFAVAKDNNLKVQLLKGFHLKNNYIKMKFGLDDPRIFENIYEALEIAKEIKSVVWQCKYYDDIAGYYKLTGDFEKALHFYKKNLTILKGIASSKDYKEFKIWGGSIEKTCLELADIHIDLKEIDSARIYNQMAKSVLDSIGENYSGVFRYRNIINDLELNIIENNIVLAKKNLSDAAEIVPKTIKKTFQKYSKLYYSGLINFHDGDYESAIYSFEAIDTTRIDINQRAGFYKGDLYKYLYKSYLKTGNLKKSDYYFEKHLTTLNEQIKVNNSVNSNFRSTEIAKYNEEVKELRNQKSKQRFYIVIIFFTSLITIVLMLLYFKNKQDTNKKKLRNLVEILKNKENKTKSKSIILNIKTNEIKRITERLNELEKKEYFLRIDCTASNVAKKLKTNTTYLSKIINVHYHKNFTNYINDFRIEYVLERLKKDKLFRKYTIQSMANEIGFKSKETFNYAFKKRMGVLPSTLIKELAKEAEKEIG
ncbi:hypothetical protein BFP77_01790 [Maribacter sp. 4U21]|uniref:helix-turn-helix domain-containing protein n=1 Tax=Maribacter sp. 4U21 TaxID=1889779 RepID=UPI000C15842B|nr:helix-turn-helix domain-containing protein [Maribacter sp. 4U21]PIB31325.1 hypothetical protein BFP77_01790 [Maribacter sp. 4U21]